MNNWRKTIFEIVETDRETTASRIYDKIMLRLFGRICNPTATNTSIFNAGKQQAVNKHKSKMWGVVYVADYKSLYS
ncbi:MAG: hypothetical protein IKJ98_03475 [Bacteroidales bacterium]|nr:hypothetical protein [Bacteroidales bacterium]